MKIFIFLIKYAIVKLNSYIGDNKVDEEFNFKEFLMKITAKGASDIHLHVDERPYVRINGSMVKVNYPPLTEDELLKILDSILPVMLKKDAMTALDMDFSYELKGITRFRVNLSRQLGKIAIIMRVIPYEIPSLQELNLLDNLNDFCHFPNGLCFVTGPTGSGKSTTLAALLEIINQNYKKHIVTIEEPIEYIYTNKKSVFTQRQIGIDTKDFQDGVKYALRQDPDVIMIGEVRDKETMSSALKAAETGHLVFATLHTNNAVQTIQRAVSLYEPNDREYIRTQVSSVLRGVISQKLLPSTDGIKRVPALEILTVTPTTRDLIEKDRLDEIYELNRQGAISNLITLNSQLNELVKNLIVSKEDAMNASYNKNELEQMLRGVYHGTRDNA